MWKLIKEKFLNKQFITFGIIGVLNTVIALLFNKGLLLLRFEVGMASIVADVLAFVPSYVMNMTFTYKKKMSWKTFITFPISYIPGWIISFLIVEILHRFLGVPENYAKLCSVPIYVPVNYLVMTYVVNRFSKPKER